MKFNNKKAFGGAASTLIMFIGIITVTTGLLISFMQYVDKAEDSVSTKNDFLSKKLETEIAIINIVYDESEEQTSIYLRNLGNTKLATKHFSVFLDDQYFKNTSTVSTENITSIMPILDIQEVGLLIINKTLNSGSHNARIITEYGVDAGEDFNT